MSGGLMGQGREGRPAQMAEAHGIGEGTRDGARGVDRNQTHCAGPCRAIKGSSLSLGRIGSQ